MRALRDGDHPHGPAHNQAGVAWYIVKPDVSTGSIAAKVALEGTNGVPGKNIIYPAIGVTASGRGVVAVLRHDARPGLTPGAETTEELLLHRRDVGGDEEGILAARLEQSPERCGDDSFPERRDDSPSDEDVLGGPCAHGISG